MQPVRQLDQYNADILRHREKHLAQIFRLHLDLVRRIIELSELCDAIHKLFDVLAKLLADFLRGHNRVLHNVMQKSCRDRLFIHLQIGKDDRHTERVDDIRLS